MLFWIRTVAPCTLIAEFPCMHYRKAIFYILSLIFYGINPNYAVFVNLELDMYRMGNFYLQYQYTLPVFSDKALSLK